MQQYSEQELDAKIHAFLTKKLDKYPAIDRKARRTRTIADPTLPIPVITSFGWFKSLAAH